MTRSKRGVVLPIVLLLILAMAALSTSALVLARTELVADRSGRRHVRDRALAEGLLRAPEPAVEGFDRREVPLAAGFRLVEARPSAPGLSYFAVAWMLDPDSVVARLPRALEAGGPLPSEGVSADDGCAVPGTRELMVRRPPALGPGGTLEETPPRLGLLGVPELVALAGVELATGTPFPVQSASPEILGARGPTLEVPGGEARGLVVAEGDLVMDGTTTLRGLLVVAGSLTLRGSARFEGVALVGRDVFVSGGAQLVGCPDLALEALRLPQLARAHLLPDGPFLGRH